ncbi:hypothetical protein BH695_2249 [Microcystis aeruginosa PCC 7806SL]|uniref:Uncharacterized protein n=1 Tax=Microcystis aeruginosa PCC 7806SL TaxID=1903187 RepID=A0AB33BP56_MICA7|nr:hypothetical protein BH695_2249 [Microcystis aeruginosa PCC 7806SL]
MLANAIAERDLFMGSTSRRPTRKRTLLVLEFPKNAGK